MINKLPAECVVVRNPLLCLTTITSLVQRPSIAVFPGECVLRFSAALTVPCYH